MAMSEEAALRAQLQQAKASRSARQLEVVLLSAEVCRLERRLRQLRADSDDSTGSEDEDAERPFAYPVKPERKLMALPGSAPGCRAPPPYPESALNTTLLLPDDPPPYGYGCFRAGEPMAWTVFNDVLTIGCHWRRSYEITQLSGCNLASDSEKSFLRMRLNHEVMEQHTVVNFMVWRRSVLLLLFLASLGAFTFSLLGDNWTAFDHMQDMQSLSHFKVSFQEWRKQARLQLPFTNCVDIDVHFTSILTSMSEVHQVVGKTCPELLQRGLTCQDLVDKAVIGCWKPGLCQETLFEHCPSACGHTGFCRDVRNARSLDYSSFTLEFVKAILYKLIEQLSKAELQKLVFSMISKFVACLLMLRAAICWADWPRSNRYVLWAWLVTFTAPFLRSIVPTPLLIDWVPIAGHMEEYLQTTDRHYDLANRMQTIAQVTGLSCSGHRLEEQTDKLWQTTHHKVHWWCGKVQWAAHWFPWSPMLQKGATECQVLNNYMGVGDVATLEAREQKERLCKVINTTHIKEGPLSGVREIVDVAWLRSAAYALVGGLSSLLSFRVVLPEALSVAPGLLTAAMRIKVVVPQSYLPGVFIAIMPLLYVPTVWSFCIFAVQGFGDPLLLVTFTLMAFSPLAYTVLGIIKQVTSPMSRNGARSFARNVRYSTSAMQFVSLVCFAIYMVKTGLHLHAIEESHKGVTAFILEEGERLLLPLLVGQARSLVSLLFSGPLWSLIFTFWQEMYMTAIVGADWMMRASAEEYYNSQGEEYFVELQDQGRLDPAAAQALHEQRKAAMEAMMDLTQQDRRPRGEGH